MACAISFLFCDDELFLYVFEFKGRVVLERSMNEGYPFYFHLFHSNSGRYDNDIIIYYFPYMYRLFNAESRFFREALLNLPFLCRSKFLQFSSSSIMRSMNLIERILR